MKTKIINCNTDLGVHIDGSNFGPGEISKALVNENIVERIEIDKDNIVKSQDKNDLEKNLDCVNNFTKKHYKIAKEIINDGFFPISVGGDHSMAIGSGLASSYLYDDLGVIWIDAHSDYNTFETTETGNLHGLPLAAITGYNCDKLTSFLDPKYINPKKCVVVGARSIDRLELPNLKDAGVTVFWMDDLRREGIDKIIDKAFEIAGDNVHVSYDLDVIDPKYAPGVTTDVLGGITKDEAFEIADILSSNIDKIKSMDLVELNPLNDIDNKTRDIAVNIINKVIDAKDKN